MQEVFLMHGWQDLARIKSEGENILNDYNASNLGKSAGLVLLQK